MLIRKESAGHDSLVNANLFVQYNQPENSDEEIDESPEKVPKKIDKKTVEREQMEVPLLKAEQGLETKSN
jgi:hypothetical protein